MFPLLSMLSINFANDFVGLATHILLFSIAGTAIYRVVRRLAPDLAWTEAAIIVLLTVFIDSKVESVRAGIIYNATLTPSWLGHALHAVFLVALVEGHLITSALITTAILAFSIKLGWLPFLLGASYTGLTAPQRLWAFVLPVIYMVWKSGSGGTPSTDPDVLRALCEMIIVRDQEEGSMRFQPPVAYLCLGLGTAAALVLGHRLVDSRLRILTLLLVGISLSALLFNEFYGFVGYRLFPRPVILMLQPIRALHTLILVACILIFAAIFRSRWLWFDKVGALLATAAFRSDSQDLAVIPPEWQALVLILIFSGVPRLLDRVPALQGRGVPWRRAISTTWVVLILLTALTVRQMANCVTVSRFNAPSYALSHRWTLPYRPDPETWDALLALRADPQDYLLTVVDLNSGYPFFASLANEVALKSQFAGPTVHFVLNPPMLAEAEQRVGAVNAMIDALTRKEPVPAEAVALQRDRGARVLLPSDKVPLLAGARVVRTFPTMTLVEF